MIRYPRQLPGDTLPARSAKRCHSEAAQRYINIRDATERLQWLLCCNYDEKAAAFLTLTFDDAHLPDSRCGVRDRVKKSIRQMRPYFRNRGDPFPVIYTVEGQPERHLPQADNNWEVAPWKDSIRWNSLDENSDNDLNEETVRLHAHMFLLLPEKSDWDHVRAAWPYGHVYINYIKVNDFRSFQRLAAYVTKESRLGVRPENEKSYIPSQGLIQPQVDGHWCGESETIGMPMGAEYLGDGHDRDYIAGYERTWISYRFPRGANQPKPYVPKGRIFSGGKSRKTK